MNVDDNDTQDLLLDALSWNQCLIQALKAGDWAESLSLVDKSACVITEEKFTGRTPLHIACSHPHEEPPFELLSALIGTKANVLARDNEGWTPLLQAVNEGHYTASAYGANLYILRHFVKNYYVVIVMYECSTTTSAPKFLILTEAAMHAGGARRGS